MPMEIARKMIVKGEVVEIESGKVIEAGIDHAAP
jgi:hypothetical protein